MRIPTPTVGDILTEEFMKPLDMSVNELAKGIGLSEHETIELLSGHLAVTPELSQRLADFLGMSDLFFYRLQLNLDRRNAILGHEEIIEHELSLA